MRAIFFLASFAVKPTANDVTVAERRSYTYRSNRKIMTILHHNPVRRKNLTISMTRLGGRQTTRPLIAVSSHVQNM